MSDNYAKIVEKNHLRLINNLPADFESAIQCTKKNDEFCFNAFGYECSISNDGFYLDKKKQEGVIGILLSLYALNASVTELTMEPLKAYKEFPDTAPYVGAFASHTESVLIPYVDTIKKNIESIINIINGSEAPSSTGGDFAFVVYPLPKIALCYIFYEADDDFPPSATCLFSNNASEFVPNDVLADIGEYTSKRIIQIVSDA